MPLEGNMVDIASLPRVATIATLASRQDTFERVLPKIRTQVDHVFVYLDGYSERPAFLDRYDGLTVYHAEDVGNLHCSSRFLCLPELTGPTIVVVVDDDIVYPMNYVSSLTNLLQRLGGEGVVGVHGRIFIPPHESYVTDAITTHFLAGVKRPFHVHELGTGTCAFVSDRLPLDPRRWDRHDMDDIVVALQAQKRGLPRMVIARPLEWLTSMSQGQTDNLWTQTKKDHTVQSRRMRELMALYGSESWVPIRAK